MNRSDTESIQMVDRHPGFDRGYLIRLQVSRQDDRVCTQRLIEKDVPLVEGPAADAGGNEEAREGPPDLSQEPGVVYDDAVDAEVGQSIELFEQMGSLRGSRDRDHPAVLPHLLEGWRAASRQG